VVVVGLELTTTYGTFTTGAAGVRLVGVGLLIVATGAAALTDEIIFPVVVLLTTGIGSTVATGIMSGVTTLAGGGVNIETTLLLTDVCGLTTLSFFATKSKSCNCKRESGNAAVFDGVTATYIMAANNMKSNICTY
jgi:hypothetical protein